MANKEVAYQFITTWRDKDPARLGAELTSFSNESNRRPDSYHFEVSEGVLIDPHTKRPIADFIEKETPLGKLEVGVAEKLGDWARNSESGVAFWISPPFEKRYPCSKVIISKIAYAWSGQKILLNSAILFDANEKDCLSIAPGGNIKDPEKLRETLFLAKDDEEAILEMLEKVNRYTKQKRENINTKNESVFFARMISDGFSAKRIVDEMHQSGFLGNFDPSCTSQKPTFSEYMVANSSITNSSETGKFVKNCGNCGAEINSVIQKGYRCPNCGGIYEGC